MRVDGPLLEDFNRRLMATLSYDATPWRLDFLRKWAAGENTGAHYNPFATTWEDPTLENPANPWWNTFKDDAGRIYHVRNYVSLGAGVEATVRTIRQPQYYATLRNVLHTESIGSARAALVADVRAWGTTAFANQLADGWEPAAPEAVTSPVHLEALTDQVIALADYVDRINDAVLGRYALIAGAGVKLLEGATLMSIELERAADPDQVPVPARD